jgi:uncharacterized C2H2 Zn-finger protein
MHIGVEDTANALGISKDTVRNATDKAEMWEVLQRRYEPYETKDGDKRTRVHITLSEATAHPDSIQMAKLHGGKRIKKCPKCGSEDVDRYTVQYCRHCNKNAWYGQPGLRADADVTRAQQAENTSLYTSSKKQDAFDTHEPESDPIAHLSTRIDNALVVTQQQAAVVHTRAQLQETEEASSHLPALPVSEPEPQQDPLLEAKKFYEGFYSKPGYHLRLRPDGAIGIGVPEQVSDTEFEHLAEQIGIQEEALRQIIQERNPTAQYSGQIEDPPSTQLATQHSRSVSTASCPETEKPSSVAYQTQPEESQHNVLEGGTRVVTPAGIARILSAKHCSILHRLRYSVRTDQTQPNGSHYAVFNACEVQPIAQEVLL